MPTDEYFLIRFNDKPEPVTNFTQNPEEILSTLSSSPPQGWTALYDAICLGLHQMRTAKNTRRALFVLSDGGDNNSRYSESEVRNIAREANVPSTPSDSSSVRGSSRSWRAIAADGRCGRTICRICRTRSKS